MFLLDDDDIEAPAGEPIGRRAPRRSGADDEDVARALGWAGWLNVGFGGRGTHGALGAHGQECTSGDGATQSAAPSRFVCGGETGQVFITSSEHSSDKTVASNASLVAALAESVLGVSG